MRLIKPVIIILLFGSSVAMAGNHSHEHAGSAMSPAMKKQHKAMATIGKQWKACKKALKDNNFKDADLAVEVIIEAASDIESFTLHTNADKQEQFAKRCSVFRENIMKLEDKIKKRDADAAINLSIKVEESCKQCHSTFRNKT